MKELVALSARAAATDSTILIEGESGVGKDLLAYAIHYASGRAQGPFVRIDCPNLNEDLLECELFGYEPGAFTDAKGHKAGKFELADAGTLYIDGVDHLSLTLQAKLLRPLQERVIERLGSTVLRKLDVRIIASTQHSLSACVHAGTFRGDLFYRLQVINLRVPPLRERPGDLLPLVERIAAETGEHHGKPHFRFSEEALRLLTAHLWPGNVRELRNVVERLAVGLPGDLVEGDAFAKALPGLGPIDAPRGPLTLREIETHCLQDALKRAGGNKSRAASMLGISRKSLYDRLKRYGVKVR